MFNDRIQGIQIDIGAYESAFSTKTRNAKEKLDEIAIFPNPTARTIKLESIKGIRSLRLLDTSGRIVQSFPVEKQLHLRNSLNAGIYFLEIDFGPDGKTFKMVEKIR